MGTFCTMDSGHFLQIHMLTSRWGSYRNNAGVVTSSYCCLQLLLVLMTAYIHPPEICLDFLFNLLIGLCGVQWLLPRKANCWILYLPWGAWVMVVGSETSGFVTRSLTFSLSIFFLLQWWEWFLLASIYLSWNWKSERYFYFLIYNLTFQVTWYVIFLIHKIDMICVFIQLRGKKSRLKKLRDPCIQTYHIYIKGLRQCVCMFFFSFFAFQIVMEYFGVNLNNRR